MQPNLSLKWYDWLLLKASVLRQHGVDPEGRVSRTGHLMPMNRKWARTIGLWGTTSPAEIMKAAGLDSKNKTQRNAFDVFKHNNHLTTRVNKIKTYGFSPPEVFDAAPQLFVACEVYAAVSRIFADSGVVIKDFAITSKSVDLGTVARDLAPRLGLLPIEVVQYYIVFSEVAMQNSMTAQEFHDLELDDLVVRWNASGARVELPQPTRHIKPPAENTQCESKT